MHQLPDSDSFLLGSSKQQQGKIKLLKNSEIQFEGFSLFNSIINFCFPVKLFSSPSLPFVYLQTFKVKLFLELLFMKLTLTMQFLHSCPKYPDQTKAKCMIAEFREDKVIQKLDNLQPGKFDAAIQPYMPT